MNHGSQDQQYCQNVHITVYNTNNCDVLWGVEGRHVLTKD